MSRKPILFGKRLTSEIAKKRELKTYREEKFLCDLSVNLCDFSG